MIYVFDSSSISVLKDFYPSTFTSFWEHFEAEVSSGNVISCREVYHELKTRFDQKRFDWLWQWLTIRKDLFITPTDSHLDFVTEIFKNHHFQQLVGPKEILRATPVADPFVIACAKVVTGCVVTQEIKKPKAAKIPNVCEYFGIKCINLEEYLKEMGWKY